MPPRPLSPLARLRAWLGFESAPPGAGAGSAAFGPDNPAGRLPPDLIEPIVEPRFGIDGWSYAGTVLEECFAPEAEAELAQAVHMICARLATAWNYKRAAQLLEEQKAYAQAYAVLEAYEASGLVLDPSLPKWRARLAAAVLGPE